MAEQPFPNPPGQFTSFTTANLEHLARLRRAAKISEREQVPEPASELATLLAPLPPELTDLIPPPPPAVTATGEQSWTVFGETKRLPPNDLPFLDPSTKLLHSLPPEPDSIIRLVRSALLAFLEICHILASDPTPDQRFGTKWEDLRDLLLNANRAINLYRPWAAKQQLIQLLESYVADARAEISRIDELESRADSLLAGLSSSAANKDLTIMQEAPATAAVETITATKNLEKLPSASATQTNTAERSTHEEGLAWSLATELGAAT